MIDGGRGGKRKDERRRNGGREEEREGEMEEWSLVQVATNNGWSRKTSPKGTVTALSVWVHKVGLSLCTYPLYIVFF